MLSSLLSHLNLLRHLKLPNSHLLHSTRPFCSDISTTNNTTHWGNTKISRCFLLGDVESAGRHFHEMPERNTVTWNCMVSGYARNGRISSARRFFDAMPDKNVRSWGAMIDGYLKDGCLEEAREVFERMPSRNVVCWSLMVKGYIEDGKVDVAREVFDVMPVRDEASWVIMVLGYLREERVVEAKGLIEIMPVLEVRHYNVLMGRFVELGRYEDAMELFGRMEDRDVVSWNTMLTCYLKEGKLDVAESFFANMLVKDTVSWNAMVQAYVKNGRIDNARSFFVEMPERDLWSWKTLLGGYVENGMMEDAVRLFEEMPKKDVWSWNLILKGYIRQGDVEYASHLFYHWIPRRHVMLWNTLIFGHQNEEALVLLREMMEEGFKPDHNTLKAIIPVCGNLASVVWGKMMHCYVTRAGYNHNVAVMTLLVIMYSKCGLLSDSVRSFHDIPKKDALTWNAMIVSHANHGLMSEASKLLENMIHIGFRPDHALFFGLLSACAHIGLVDEGFKIFLSMVKDWKMDPKPEHYLCIVNLLRRSKSVSDVNKLIERIPVDIQPIVWTSLTSERFSLPRNF